VSTQQATILQEGAISNSTVPVPPLAFISKSDFIIVNFTVAASSSEEHPATATVNADWCQVIEVADHKVSISVDANTGYPGRSEFQCHH